MQLAKRYCRTRVWRSLNHSTSTTLRVENIGNTMAVHSRRHPKDIKQLSTLATWKDGKHNTSCPKEVLIGLITPLFRACSATLHRNRDLKAINAEKQQHLTNIGDIRAALVQIYEHVLDHNHTRPTQAQRTPKLKTDVFSINVDI